MSDLLLRASLVLPPRGGVLPGNPAAVLLHGMTGTPQELQLVGEMLAEEGYRVIIPCLPGHATSVQELKVTPLEAFLELMREISPYLKHRGSIVVGSSFGALLALWLALEARHAPRATVLISPPFRFRARHREVILPLLAMLPEAALDTLGYSKKAVRAVAIARPAYPIHSVAAAARLMRLRGMVKPRLKELSMPILLAQDPFDHHLDPAGTDRIIEVFGSEQVDTLWLPHGQHELASGPEAQALLQGVREFLRQVRKTHAT
ncbi:MAG: alpha/beta fold hydrolase [Proteobacteria bacterium]|nr:alpha/beta fold hydrolase [Pseudomonadota bacterium]